MACPVPSVIVLLLVVLQCHSSQPPPSLASSLSSGHQHRHRQQNHHHKPRKSPTSKDAVDIVRVIQDALREGRVGEGLGAQHTQKRTTGGHPPESYSTPAAAVSMIKDSASFVDNPFDARRAERVKGHALPQRSYKRLDVRHEHIFHSTQRPDQHYKQPAKKIQPYHPERQTEPSEPSRTSSPKPGASSQKDMTTRGHVIEHTRVVGGKQDAPLSDHDDNKDASATTTKRKTAALSVDVQNEDEASNKNPSQESTPPTEASMEARDQKLENRPPWQLISPDSEEDDDDAVNDKDGGAAGSNSQQQIVEDNSSNNASRRQGNKDEASDPEQNKGPRKSWNDNRPGLDDLRESQDRDEAHESISNRSPVNHSERSNVSSPTKNSFKKNKGGKKNKTKRKKAKKDKNRPPVYRKESQKNKWQRKQKKPVPKGCPGCTKTESRIAEAKEIYKKVLKAQLLDKLRLVPTFKKAPWPPKLPDEVFQDPLQRDHADYEDRYYAKPTQLLVFGRDMGSGHRLKKPGTGSFEFKVTDKVKGAVTSARLWVYKMKDAHDVYEQTLVVTELQYGRRGKLRERSLVARLDTHVQEGWVSFDITSLVSRWMENETPASLQMLAIRCRTCHRTKYRAIFGVKSNFRPVLVVNEAGHVDKGKSKRSTCDPTNGCCKFDMVVHFSELGINEIFRPRSIKADYCFGTCERPDMYHYNHTMIMQHLRFNSQVGNATLRHMLQPCCVPVVLREATIFHYLNDGLDTEVSLVPNLLVERCGCA